MCAGQAGPSPSVGAGRAVSLHAPRGPPLRAHRPGFPLAACRPGGPRPHTWWDRSGTCCCAFTRGCLFLGLHVPREAATARPGATRKAVRIRHEIACDFQEIRTFNTESSYSPVRPLKLPGPHGSAVFSPVRGRAASCQRPGPAAMATGVFPLLFPGLWPLAAVLLVPPSPPHGPHARPGGVCVQSGCLQRGTVVSPSQCALLFLSCDAAQTIRAERWVWEPWMWRSSCGHGSCGHGGRGHGGSGRGSCGRGAGLGGPVPEASPGAGGPWGWAAAAERVGLAPAIVQELPGWGWC